MRRLLLPAGLICALCSSCLPVPYDQSLSNAAVLTAKMTQDTSSAIDAGDDGGDSRTDWVYNPSVSPGGGFDYAAGFAVSRQSSSIEIRAVAGGSVYASSSQSLPGNLDSHYPPYLLWPLKSGVSFLFGTALDSLDPSGNGYGTFAGAPPNQLNAQRAKYSDLFAAPTPLSFASLQVLGVSVAANQGPSDWLHLLIQDLTALPSQRFAEGSFPLSSAGLSESTFIALRGTSSYQIPIPSGTVHVAYFYDEATGRSVASWYDSSSSGWTCYIWDSVSAYVRLPITHRIDALLTTGQLLSTENGTARLYDRDGNLLATFDLHDLVYIAEEYVDGQARCYFSQALFYDHAVHFNVYWIPTARLASLGS